MERAPARPSPLTPIDAGGDVLLHPVAVADACELHDLIERNIDRLREWLPWATPAYSLNDTLRFLEQSEADNASRQAIVLNIRAGGALCGAIGVHRIDPRNRTTSLGYWLASEFEGRGIMTRSCRAVITEVFQGYGVHRVEIRCGTGNTKSAAVPRRLGFREEGILREAEWVHNRWVDLRVFGMLQQDWR